VSPRLSPPFGAWRHTPPPPPPSSSTFPSSPMAAPSFHLIVPPDTRSDRSTPPSKPMGLSSHLSFARGLLRPFPPAIQPPTPPGSPFATTAAAIPVTRQPRRGLTPRPPRRLHHHDCSPNPMASPPIPPSFCPPSRTRAPSLPNPVTLSRYRPWSSP
jgi:hypothetical protein